MGKRPAARVLGLVPRADPVTSLLPTPGRQAVLRDPRLDAALARDGYVVVPFLGRDEVADLAARHEELRPAGEGGMAVDFVRDDRSVIHGVAAMLEPMWDRHLPDLFSDYEPVTASFLIKYPGPDSEMPLHAEMTFLDSVELPTYNIWVPLVDVSVEKDNGALTVIPGSERLPAGILGFNTAVLWRPYEAYLREHGVSLDVPAGSAVIYDSRMLHESASNHSTEIRSAFGAVLAPRGVSLAHVVATGRRGRKVYAVDRRFFLDFRVEDVGARIDDEYPLLRELEDECELSPAVVADALGSARVPVPHPSPPADVCEPTDNARRAALDAHPVIGAVLPEHDVEVLARDLTDVSIDGGWLSIGSHYGDVTLLDARALPVDEGLSRSVRSFVDRGTRDARVVVADSGSMVDLEIEGDGGLDLAVAECLVSGAGVLGDQSVGLFVLGCRTSVTGPGPFRLWNDGPGPVWLVATRPDAGGRLRRLLRR